jgi:hypothetical protein
MDREWSLDPSTGLHQRTADELAILHDRLCRAIPDDFEFSLTFENGEIDGSLEYQNGMMAGFGGGLPVRPDRNFIENLRNFDWDGMRNQAMTATESMDSQFQDLFLTGSRSIFHRCEVIAKVDNGKRE